jgi:hypothetical protein
MEYFCLVCSGDWVIDFELILDWDSAKFGFFLVYFTKLEETKNLHYGDRYVLARSGDYLD